LAKVFGQNGHLIRLGCGAAVDATAGARIPAVGRSVALLAVAVAQAVALSAAVAVICSRVARFVLIQTGKIYQITTNYTKWS
jgi:hypothetical protein